MDSRKDANTRLFHLRANGRRWKKFIPALTVGERTCTAQDDKARAIKDHFQEHLGQPPRRECTLNWEEIPVSRYNLSDLGAYLTEEEIKTVVMHTPTEKALVYAHSQKARGHNSHRLSAYKCDA
jgi:hypothetical protein